MIAVAVAAAITFPVQVLAHGEDQRLSVDPATVAAGGTITVRGDIESTGPIDLVLVTSAAELALGTVEDAPEGHFEELLTVPASAPVGSWALEARVAGLDPVSAAMMVTAPGGEDGADQEAEPIGRLPQGLVASPAAVAIGSAPASPSPEDRGPAQAPIVLLLGVALLLLAVGIRRRRSATPVR